jgi:hypothetical protein
VSALARESVVIDNGSRRSARRRKGLVRPDPSLYDAPVKFRVIVSIGVDPPAEALELLALPQPPDPCARGRGGGGDRVGESSAPGRSSGVEAVLTARHVLGERAARTRTS